MSQKPTPDDWNACANIASKHGRSFFLASRLLPSARRRGILSVYAYCRIADDIVDRAEPGKFEDARAELTAWSDQLSHPRHPVAIAFASARDEFGIPETPVHELIMGINSDLEPVDMETWEDLERYSYLVAGTVGLMVAPILGCSNQAALSHAAELGMAMQLTNILRDVAEDAAMGRLYLPRKELAWYGVSSESVLACTPEDGFRDFMAFQVMRARMLYASAMRGVPYLSPSGRATTLAAARLYAGILDQIEDINYDVFRGRVAVPGRRKAKIMAGVAGSWMVSALGSSTPASSETVQSSSSYSARPPGQGAIDLAASPGQHHD